MKKFAVSKIFFNECVEYLRKINNLDIEELDLTDFTNRDLNEEIKQLRFSGLSNKDFIKSLDKTGK